MTEPIVVRPVDRESWEDFVRLFESRGAPHYCWCTPYRTPSQDLTADERKDYMRGLVMEGTPIGVLAYDGDEPVGWCSIAPRETYGRLDRSRTMPRNTPEDTPTWTVLCFFVARSHRRTGLTKKLLEGAVAHARQAGARVVEGYPFDAAGLSSTHRGHSSAFAANGFAGEGRRWSRSLAGAAKSSTKG